MNAFVFEGRMFGTGGESGTVGGDEGICCDARRDEGVPVTRGDICEMGRGDGGTELRSGAMVVVGSVAFRIEGRFLAAKVISVRTFLKRVEAVNKQWIVKSRGQDARTSLMHCCR